MKSTFCLSRLQLALVLALASGALWAQTSSATPLTYRVPVPGLVVLSNAQLSVTPSVLAFGTVVQGNTSAEQLVTVANTGQAPLTLNSADIGGSGDFQVSSSTCHTVAGGASCKLGVVFSPKTAEGAVSTSLSLKTTAGAYSIALSGTAAGACIPGSQAFSFTGASVQFAVPSGCTTVAIKAWGGGGSQGRNYGGGFAYGGGGGFAGGVLQGVRSGTILTLKVGQGATGTTVLASGMWPGGGSSGSGIISGGGGGYSGVFLPDGTPVLVAGGGGGGGYGTYSAGAGGGTSGVAGSGGGGGGGTQSVGGASTYQSLNCAATPSAGSAYQGGTGQANSGGGGGGYFGGAGGSTNYFKYQNCGGGTSGGGGSGYGSPALSSPLLVAGSARTPGNSSDSDNAGAGFGGPSGGNGRIVLSWSQ